MTSAFKRLWNSTKSLHERFNLYPPNTDSAIKVFKEEVEEVIFEANRATAKELPHEAADVIVTLMGILMSRGVDYSSLIIELQKVAIKNDAKNLKTHYINNEGKIQRNGRK